MRKFFICAAVVCLVIAVSGCDILGGSYQYKFENQTLQGKINGKDFEFASGYAEASYFDEGSFDIELYNIMNNPDTEPYSLGAYDHDDLDLKIMFAIPAESGLYELHGSILSPDSRSATLVDWNDGPMNIICNEGAIEITVNTEAGTITGKADIYYDEENFVNGTFTIPIAPED